jgi:hypothetical protein
MCNDESDEERPSRKAAKECSPQRKLWASRIQVPEGRQKRLLRLPGNVTSVPKFKEIIHVGIKGTVGVLVGSTKVARGRVEGPHELNNP